MNVDNKERKEESRLTTRIHFSVLPDYRCNLTNCLLL